MGPVTGEQAEMALHWLNMGLLNDTDLHIQSPADMLCMTNYLSLINRVPHELFSKMHVPETLMSWGPMAASTLDMLKKQGIHNQATGVEGEFFQTYIAPAT